MKNTRVKRIIAILTAMIVVCSTAAGCGAKEDVPYYTSNDEGAENSASDDKDTNDDISDDKDTNDSASDDTNDDVSDDVSAGNLSMKEISLCDTHLASEEPIEGFAIEVTVKNNSDYSVDVAPVIDANIKYTDEYEDEQTMHVRLGEPMHGCICPYSVYGAVHINDGRISSGNGNFQAVGLAPKEEKTVSYYFSYNNSIIVYDLDDNKNRHHIDNFTLTDIKLVDVIGTKTTERVYVDVDEWGDKAKLEDLEKKYFKVHVGKTLTGEFENNTEYRWESAKAQFVIMVDDQIVKQKIYREAEFIGIGKSLSFRRREESDVLTIVYEEDTTHDCEIIPALMYYLPEKTGE